MIDIDGLFENYFKKYIAENLGKMTEQQIEDKIPEIYEAFGKTPQIELGGKTPEDFYRNFSDDDLVSELENAVIKNGEVSDFLCKEIEKRSGISEKLVRLISADGNEEVATYAVNMLSGDLESETLGGFVKILTDKGTGESLAESLTEYLSGKAEEVKEYLIAEYSDCDSGKQYLVEIMSKTLPDDRIFNILLDEFKNNRDNTALYANYLAVYGDDRAIPYLTDRIEESGITYYDFKEIKNAIEELGGEYDGQFKKN